MEPGQGEPTERIEEVWVYTERGVLGAFPLPADIPLLLEDLGESESLTFLPGIRANGVSASRKPYPFYRAVTLDLAVVPGKSDTLVLSTGYADGVDVVVAEDFETANRFIEAATSTAEVVRTTDPAWVLDGQGSGYIALGPGAAVLTATTNEQQYPRVCGRLAGGECRQHDAYAHPRAAADRRGAEKGLPRPRAGGAFASGDGRVGTDAGRCVGRLVWRSGRVAEVVASRTGTDRIRRWEAFGEAMKLEVDFLTRTAARTTSDGMQPLDVEEGNPLKDELQAFLQAAQGAGAVGVTLEEGLSALGLAERILACIGTPTFAA